jgi:iron-sulfur cluster repair protein YtfE (RIC family)
MQKLNFIPSLLPKLSREEYPEDALLHWAKFFHSKNREEFKEMAAKGKYINEAYQALEGIKLGLEQGMDRTNQLTLLLLKENRLDFPDILLLREYRKMGKEAENK